MSFTDEVLVQCNKCGTIHNLQGYNSDAICENCRSTIGIRIIKTLIGKRKNQKESFKVETLNCKIIN